MVTNLRYLLLAYLSLISNAAAHSTHANHTENKTAASQSVFSSLISGYPDSTTLIVVAELVIGVLLVIVAVWHFRKTS